MAPAEKAASETEEDFDKGSTVNEKDIEADGIKPVPVLEGRYRERWCVFHAVITRPVCSFICSTYYRYQIWFPDHPPRAPYPSIEDAPEIPVARASFWSLLTFTWITPIMVLGWQRPLQVRVLCLYALLLCPRLTFPDVQL